MTRATSPASAATAQAVDLRAIGPGRSFTIPESTAPVEITRLRVDVATGASTQLVRFPADWARPTPGHYRAGEDFVVLAGSLAVNDVTYGAGDWALLARGHRRANSHAGPDGALAVAWFDREARWVAGGHHVPELPPRHRRVADGPSGRETAPLGARGERLHQLGGISVWLTDPPRAGTIATCDTEILALADWRWVHVPAGAATPDLAGACLMRSRA